MRRLLSTGLATALTLLPLLGAAQTGANCGVAGTPPCPLPDPETWPLVALALGVLAVVRHLNKRK
ncbi:MAG: hypothetical protein HY020_03585 [Burkholderiales bacterium]|nr:hypothetical protein [Burkholderiales bacterium]